MNNTAKIQASFSLPDVLLEDKIERIGNNQTKMINTKKRSRVIDSNAIVYAGQRFAATRREGFLPLNFIRRTELSATTKLSAEHETPPFG